MRRYGPPSLLVKSRQDERERYSYKSTYVAMMGTGNTLVRYLDPLATRESVGGERSTSLTSVALKHFIVGIRSQIKL
jgi:hypothetical protein